MDKFLYLQLINFLQIKISSKPVRKESKDIDSSAKELLEPKEENVEQKPFATQQEIESKKLPPEEILSLPMFKVRETWIS